MDTRSVGNCVSVIRKREIWEACAGASRRHKFEKQAQRNGHEPQRQEEPKKYPWQSKLGMNVENLHDGTSKVGGNQDLKSRTQVL